MRIDTQTILLLVIPTILLVLLILRDRQYAREVLEHEATRAKLRRFEAEQERRRKLFRAPTKEEIEAARRRNPDFRAHQFYDFRNTGNKP